MPRAQWSPCPTPDCPHLVPRGGDCVDAHAAAKRAAWNARTEANRPNARARGYDQTHAKRFRSVVLQRDPVCVLCKQQPSVHADHHPRTRAELTRLGEDPNDPRHGRGLCSSCHSTETARHDGGYGNPKRMQDDA